MAKRPPPRSDLYPPRLNCPLCGKRLTYKHTDGDVRVYHCAADGIVQLPPNGPVRVVVH